MKSLFIKLLLFLFILSYMSCVSTRIEASPHDSNVSGLECHKKSSWGYWWGINEKRIDVNPDTEGVVCPCREEAMAWVEVKTSIGDFLLNLITIGIVSHRTVIYGCAKPSDGEQEF